MADETVPNLRDKMAKVIRETVPLHSGGYRTADAVRALFESELAAKEEEIARWKRLAEAQQKTMKELAVACTDPIECGHEAALGEAEEKIRQLRAGEADEPADEGVQPTPGQWLTRFHALTAERRLEVIERALRDSERSARCFMMNHEARLARQAEVT